MEKFKIKFEFNGSKDKFLKELKFGIKESLKDYRYEFPDDNHINIGFKRLGHSGGRWFISEFKCENNQTILNGSFKDVYLTPHNRIAEFFINIFFHIIVYLILFGIIFGIWLINRFNNIVLFALPIIIILALRFIAIYQDHQT